MIFLNVVSNILGGSMWIQVLTVLLLLVLNINFGNHAFVDGQVSPSSSFSFPSFPVDTSNIITNSDAVYNSSFHSYDLTANYTGSQRSPCGRIVYKDKVRMVEKASGKVASFNTSFTFSFHSRDIWPCGHGMAFTFVSSPEISLVESTNRSAHGMCRFDYEDRSASQNVFAVTFDSYRYMFDSNREGGRYDEPSDGNIGVVIIKKGNTTLAHYNLCGTDITDCKFFCGDKGAFTAWIDYDSARETLEVRFRAGSFTSDQKPAGASLSVSIPYNALLEEVLDEEMYVGFSSSTRYTDYDREIHRISAWNFSSSIILVGPAPSPSPLAGTSESRQSKSKAGLIAGICAALLGAALMGLLLFCYFKHRNKQLVPSKEPVDQQVTSGLNTDTSSRPYTFKELSSITKDFNDSELLSSGAFGDVYKGTPPAGGSLVAVKRIKEKKEHGQASFLAEANSLRHIRHRNLLQLRGWCEAKEGLFLVYDFMSNGSLDKWIHSTPSSGQVSVFDQGLSWNVRRFILAGVAAGLEYLHDGWVQCVLHRDIKSSNVMLDANFNAYLGDFGLARLVDHQKLQKTTIPAGTLGYMAPEIHYTGKATKETDVYAFGVLVLEVVCGRRPILGTQGGDEPGDFLLLDRVWRAHEARNITNMVDPRLLDQADASCSANRAITADLYDGDHSEMMASILQVGLLCCLPNPSERPSMRLVNHWLQSREVGAMEFPSLPAMKPAAPHQFSVPPLSEGTSSSQWSDVTRSSAQTSTRSSEN